MGRKKHKKNQKTSDVVAGTGTNVGVHHDDGQRPLHLAQDDPSNANILEPQSSWFSGVDWISKKKRISRHANHELPQSSSLHHADVDTAKHGEKSHSSLLSKLNKIKQQLMPAAAACATTVNQSRKGTNDNRTTTPEYEFRQARSNCNPYESLGKTYSKNHSNRHKKKSGKRKHYSSPGLSQFINRSAIKLANIDALLGFILTSMDDKHDDPNSFVFVDLCGAPGGFSEYILYRYLHPLLAHHKQSNPKCNNKSTNHECKACYGFGMSLVGKNDDGKGVPWELDHLKRYHLHSSSNDTTSEERKGSSAGDQILSYHTCHGSDETGSIYNWDNVLQLQRQIYNKVPRERDAAESKSLANLVVADGGFDAQRDSNNQEEIAHKIIVSQTAAALTLLRPGGNFVLKMFGFREEGTRRMLHYLYNCFDRMTFVKPVLSRPASAERYLVCCGYSGHVSEWDGLVWRDDMMLPLNEMKPHAQGLEELMDSFDMDMLQLNIDSCKSIIDFLNYKRESMEQAAGGARVASEMQHDYLDLQAYESTWKLNP